MIRPFQFINSTQYIINTRKKQNHHFHNVFHSGIFHISLIQITHGNIETLSPVSLTMLSSFIQIIEQILINLITNLTQMLVDRHRLILPVLTRPTISRINIKLHTRVHLLSRQDLLVEVFTVPPKTRTHANRFGEPSWSGISSIATDQPSQATPCNSIGTLYPSLQPIILKDGKQLLLNEIQVLIPFASKFLRRVIRVSVLIVSIIGIPYPHDDYLPHLTLSSQLVDSVLDHPRSTEGCLTVIEQILPVVHQQHLVLLESVVEIRRRVIDTALPRVTQYFGRDIGLIDHLIGNWMETGKHLDDPLPSSEDPITAKHPHTVIQQQFHTDIHVLRTQQRSLPLICSRAVQGNAL